MDQARKLQERWWRTGNTKWLSLAKDAIKAGNITEMECLEA